MAVSNHFLNFFALPLLMLFSSLLPATLADDKAQSNPLPADQQLQLFLLIGQSNMVGRGVVEAEDLQTHPRIWSLDKELNWIPAKDPLHFDKPKSDGVGPGLTFAKTIAQADPKSFVGLIPCAVGGTSIDEWKKGDKLYNAAILRAKAAIKHGKIKGILWHQGEADSDPDAVKAYPAKLTQLLADFRADLDCPDAPVVVGELGSFRVPSPIPFNKMLANLVKTIPHCGLVSADGLTDKRDGRHFNSASQREFGRRYAAVYLKLVEEQ